VREGGGAGVCEGETMSARIHRIYLVSDTRLTSVCSEDAAAQFDRQGYTRITRQQYNLARKLVPITRQLRRARG
jgi:hypothetical protein